MTKFALYQSAMDVLLHGQHAVVANGEDVVIVNVADPRRPRKVAELPAERGAGRLAIDGVGVLYIAGGASELAILDISNPAAPRMIARYQCRQTVSGLASANGRLYLGEWWNDRPEVEVLDITDLTHPRPLGVARFEPRGQSEVEMAMEVHGTTLVLSGLPLEAGRFPGLFVLKGLADDKSVLRNAQLTSRFISPSLSSEA